MVRGIEYSDENGEMSCSHCGYEFSSFEDAQHHWEHWCDPSDTTIEPYQFEVTVRIEAPANNQDKAKQNVMNWFREARNAVGGLSPYIEEFKHPHELEEDQ